MQAGAAIIHYELGRGAGGEEGGGEGGGGEGVALRSELTLNVSNRSCLLAKIISGRVTRR